MWYIQKDDYNTNTKGGPRMSKYLAIMSKKLMSNLTYRLATVLNMLAMSTYFLASYYF